MIPIARVNTIMEGQLQLVYRIAQLETELRLATEQNAQAEGTIRYLLDLLRTRADAHAKPAIPPILSESPRLGSVNEDHIHDDLLSFSDDEVLPNFEVPVNRVPMSDCKPERPRFHVQPPALLIPEYNRLMGAACFIEEMSASEQVEHWQEFARKHSPRRPAGEWATLYASEIRPVFLSKMQARHGPENAAAGSDSQVRRDSAVESCDSPRSDATSMLIDHKQPQSSSRVTSMTAMIGYALSELNFSPDALEAGIHFSPPSTDTFPYRSVLISDIPAGAFMKDVLDRILDFNIVRVRYLKTQGMRLDAGVLRTNMAMVVFANGESARNCVSMHKGRLTVPMGDMRIALRMRLIQTATRPA